MNTIIHQRTCSTLYYESYSVRTQMSWRWIAASCPWQRMTARSWYPRMKRISAGVWIFFALNIYPLVLCIYLFWQTPKNDWRKNKGNKMKILATQRPWFFIFPMFFQNFIIFSPILSYFAMFCLLQIFPYFLLIFWVFSIIFPLFPILYFFPCF